MTGAKGNKTFQANLHIPERYIDLAGVIMIAIDKGGEVAFINLKGCEVLGCVRNEIIGKNWFENFIPKRSQKEIKGIFKGIMSGKTKLAEYHENAILNKKGEEKIVSWHNVPLKDGNGRICGTLSSGLDITEKIELENNLRKSEKAFRLAFENSEDAIFWADVKTGVIVRCNKAAETLLERSSNEIIGKCQSLLHPPEDKKHYERIFKRHAKVKKSFEEEVEIITKSGIKKIVQINATVIPNNGQIIVQGIFRDITYKKRSEQMIRESEKRYRAIFEQAADSIVLFRADTGDFIEFNDKACEALGYTREEFAKLKIADFEVAESPEEVKKHIRNIAKKGSDIFETKQRTKNGQILDVLVSAKVITLYGEKYVQTIWRDVSERKKTRKELEVLNKQLMKTNKKLKESVVIDPQTELYNHRYMTEAIEAEFNRAKRYAQPIAAIMLDIDYFKSINDVYGHQYGDLILKQFASQLKRMVRPYDIVARYGGEEFVIISPGADKKNALALAQRILDAVNLYNFGNREQNVKIKLSMAVVSYPEDVTVRALNLIEVANEILDKAKELGGNRVCSVSDLHKKEQPSVKDPRESPDVKRMATKIDGFTKKANQNLTESIFAFAKTIEMKDHYTGEHVENTVRYATEIARAMGMNFEEIERVKKAAILHDLGKIGIREKILLKKGKLTSKEFEEIKQHPKIAIDIIRPIHFLHDIIPLILHHHENWNGMGYPHGLKGEEIPLGARIISIADAYQALTSNRPYRKAYSKERALEIMKQETGTKFDPEIVRVFIKIVNKER